MSFHSQVCPSCKKEIQVPDDVDNARCMYCGANISTQPLCNQSQAANIDNYLGLARTALAADNVEEAEKYFTLVLEQNPSISEAWFGKGKAAALQSSLNKIRLNDAIVSFKNAIGVAQDNEKEKVLEECINEINNIAVYLYSAADKHLKEFVSLPNIYEDYVTQMLQLISALEEVAEWNPNNKVVLENIMHYCTVLIEGVQYKDQYDNNTPKAWNLTPEYETLMRNKIAATSEKIKAIDPSYEPPNPEAKKAEACFVITATMGDPYHPYVCLLRKFRDEWLTDREFGRKFISWYYQHGPSLAEIIRRSRILRYISFYLVVLPATKLAKLLIK